MEFEKSARSISALTLVGRFAHGTNARQTANSINDNFVASAAQNEITGMSLLVESYLVEVLEGGRNEVMKAYEQLKSDKRLDHVEMLSCDAIGERDFREWNLSFVSFRGDDLGIGDRIKDLKRDLTSRRNLRASEVIGRFVAP